MTKYILDENGDPVATDDLLAWAQWFETARDQRRLARDMIGPSKVSTVFLGLEHGARNGRPLLWETLVFGGPLADEQERYISKAEALAGHAAMLERVCAAEAI